MKLALPFCFLGVSLALVIAAPTAYAADATTPAAEAPTAVAQPLPEPAPPSQLPTKGGETKRGKRAQVNSAAAIRINYSYAAWNTSGNAVDNASLIMREGATGHLVQVHLVETGPNTGVFSGLYSINWKNVEQMQLEFYVPDQKLLGTPEGLKQIGEKIAKGELAKHPFILRRAPGGGQTIELFDTRDQAQAALMNYRAQQQQLTGIGEQKSLPLAKKIPSDDSIATDQLAEKEMAARRELEAEAERQRIAQEEAKRLADLMAEQAKVDAAEKERRQQEARNVANGALAQYNDGKFADASTQFSKAVELDPENHSYYYQYGVTLYKTGDFNKSLAYLNMSEGEQINSLEKNFFLGLDYLRLKDYDKAIATFEPVAKSGDPDMGAAATFYQGVIHFEQKEWTPAKDSFQIVLDKGKDPELDKRAENYIEQILRIQQFEAERARKWQLSATVGEMYDSNVNLNSNSSLSQGGVTNVDGNRSLFIGSARYRPVYDEETEFAAQLDVISMYTVDTSFAYNQTLRNADPTVVTLTAPWTHKGLLLDKGYKFDVTPGFESISMSIEDNTNKQILYSFFVNFSNLFVMSERLYSNFNLEIRHDQNTLASENGDNDSTAYKVRLVNSNLHFLTADKTKILTSEIDYTINTAIGRNMTYNRVDLGVGYLQPVGWDTTANFKLGYYYLEYPGATLGRYDSDLTATLGASKKISDIYSSALVASYNGNNSDVDTFAYSKFTVMLTFSALWAF